MELIFFCKNEYAEYVRNGFVIACFYNNDIKGINAVTYDRHNTDYIDFNGKISPAYLAGFAVNRGCSGKGIGTRLLLSSLLDIVNNEKDTNYIYARINEFNSMSKNIFLKNGFQMVVDESGNNVRQIYSYIGNNGKMINSPRNFMDMVVDDKQKAKILTRIKENIRKGV